MNNSGDAAEQIVRMTLEGVEVAAKITGATAKEIAIMLLAALKSPEKNKTGGLKLKGKERLNTMLKSGKALEIFSLKENDLQQFVQEAKRYGIVYCVLRNSGRNPEGLCDIMVKADDAPKINRLVERFKFAAVNKAKIDNEIVREKIAESPSTPSGAGPETSEINNVDKLLNELMGPNTGKSATEKSAPEKNVPQKSERGVNRNSAPAADLRPEPDPLAAGGRNTTAGPPPTPTQFEPISTRESKPARDTLNKPSVKEELREITAAKKAKEAEALKREDIPSPVNRKSNPETIHRQPQRGKSKPITTKGAR